MSALTDAFLNCEYQYARITFTDTEGVQTQINSSNIIENGLIIDRSVASSSKIELGSTIASELTLTLDNANDDFDDVTFTGGELFVELGCEVNGTVQYLPCGVFIVDTSPRKIMQLKIQALDRLIKFDKECNFDFTDNITITDLIDYICEDRDVTCATDLSDLVNNDYEVSAEFLNSYTGTMRELLGWCAFLTATCCYMNGNGNLEFKWFTNSSYTYSEALRTKSDLYESNNQILGLVYTDNDGNVFTCGNDQRAISYSGCDILEGDNIEAVLNGIYTQITGLTYRPFTAAVLPSPFLEPLDLITYVKDNVSYTGAVTAVNIQINGNTVISGVGETTLYENSATKSNDNSEISKVKQELSNAIENLEVNINGNFGIDDELLTNVKPYFLHGDAYYSVARKKVIWNNSDTYIFSSTPYSFIAQQTSISEADIQLRETTYSSGVSYSYANTVGFTIGGQQVYYTSIGTDVGAYSSYTFTNPQAVYGNNVDVKAFEVRLPRSTVKTVAKWDWELVNGEYIPKIIKNRTTDQKANGFKFYEDGTSLVKADFETEIPPIVLVTDLDGVPSDAPIGTVIGLYTDTNGGDS